MKTWLILIPLCHEYRSRSFRKENYGMDEVAERGHFLYFTGVLVP